MDNPKTVRLAKEDFIMGVFVCKDGTKVELIFDDEGNFEKFGDEATEEDKEKFNAEMKKWYNSGVKGGREDGEANGKASPKRDDDY